jgi:hypothetical protein
VPAITTCPEKNGGTFVSSGLPLDTLGPVWKGKFLPFLALAISTEMPAIKTNKMKLANGKMIRFE